MAKLITYLVENWKRVVPVLLVAVCTMLAASRPTFWNVTGILIGTVWFVLVLRSGWDSSAPDSLRRGGLTPGMELAMARALKEKKDTAPDLPKRSDTPLEPPASWQRGEPQPKESEPRKGETPNDDPLVKVKLGGREIFHRITQGLKNDRGVHIESLLACLGALAGYACQACVRENNTRTGAASPESGLTVAQGADGRRYFFGDPLNRVLVEDRCSVWSFTAGAVQHLGKPLPDIEGIFKHVASTVGGAEFGIPRIPEGHRPGDMPINYLKAVWPQLLPIAKRFANEPAHLPMIYGLAIQHAIFAARNTIDPTLAGSIAMECAVPMSKVDLG